MILFHKRNQSKYFLPFSLFLGLTIILRAGFYLEDTNKTTSFTCLNFKNNLTNASLPIKNMRNKKKEGTVA